MKILVIGDSCEDRFIYGECKRLSQEAPVPVFSPSYTTTNGGMAENVYNNLKAIDPALEVELITNPIKPIKTRYVEEKSNQHLLRVDEFDEVAPCNVEEIDFSVYEAVLVSDYSKGFLSKEDLTYIACHSKISFLDTKKPLNSAMKAFTYIKVNKHEWENSKNLSSFTDWNKKLIVTLGEEGCEYDGKKYPVGEKVVSADISGAGDSFMAAFAQGIISGATAKSAIIFANSIASQVVKKRGVNTI